MNTSRTISNISYNTDNFFKSKVFQLFDSNKIDFCYWIRHQPDEDDKKEHIHFVLKPSSRINTNDLLQEFKEFLPLENLPRCCTSVWRYTNSLDDWLLYCVHDSVYLQSKHLSRNHHYTWDDFQSTDSNALQYDIAMIDSTSFNRLAILEQAALDGTPFFQLVQNKIIPISQRAQYEYQYEAIKRYHYSIDK